MRPLSSDRKLEIARRVHQTFDLPKRWLQGGWGRDDNGAVIEFDTHLHVIDDDYVHHPPAFRHAAPESPRCFCLGTAIHMHTVSVLHCDSSDSRHPTETMCALYTELAAIDAVSFAKSTPDGEPHLNAITVWNDDDQRTYADVLALTAAVQHHLQAYLC